MTNLLPLLEKKVLVPRGEKQAKSFSQLVSTYGGIPVEIPLIAFRPIEDHQELQSILKNLNTYDWIIFTSNVTVETFFSFIKKEELNRFPQVAVIGKKTAESLIKRGVTPDFVPTAYVAESFVEEFLPNAKSGTRVLLPKGNLAREYIATTLSEHGALVDEVVIYETYLPDDSRRKLVYMLEEKLLDILLFTSPSTVDHFMDIVRDYRLEKKITDCIIGCIGPVTERKLVEYGLPVHASPSEYTVKEMINSTIAYLEQ
jgi:uroporphyrinogen-III synthase